MEIKVFDSAVEVSQYVAQMILEEVKRRSDSVLGLATGRTMDAIYHQLVWTAQKNKVSFKDVRSFAVDEYVGLKAESENSYQHYLNFHLYQQLDFNRKNTHIMKTSMNRIDDTCFQYEELIKKVGGIDLQLLGIGMNGHVGLNEPGSSLDSRTRVVALSSTTLKSNKTLFYEESIPNTAVTMGIGTILESKKCLLIATGETKSKIIQRLVNGDVCSQLPASALKTHKNCELILDRDAAKLI